jgi:hypothetical protein
MAALDKTAVSLRLFGDDVDPDEITARLGGAPTRGVRKGGTWPTATGVSTPARTGSWLLKVERRQPGDLDGQIAEILSGLTDNLFVWQDLTTRFKADLFCGLFMHEGNEGLSLSATTMREIGSRGLVLALDVYGPDMQD